MNNDYSYLRREMGDTNMLDFFFSSGYDWIPNSSRIRPSPKVAQSKQITMLSIKSSWVHFDDYFICKIFGKAFEVSSDNRFIASFRTKEIYDFCVVDNIVTKDDRVFQPNNFPYDVKGNHWLLWYGCKCQSHTSEEINDHVCSEVNKIVSKFENLTFDYIWYINPKMSLPEFFHVHVFWETFIT